ncbi:MAG TPA: flagellar filament capping protein FliD [Chloroflexota bacterium]|nr:flagellar filament capping protein FliD [Chloroflexota bacterium]
MAINSTSSSTTSGTSSFNVDGVVSGLKTTDIINALMTLQKAPLNQLTKQQSKVQARDAAYQELSAKVVTFQGSVQNLLLSSAVNAKAATTSAPTVATATANSSAVNGSFSINVGNLATATSATSNGTLGSAATLSPATLVSAAGLSLQPSNGTFTVNGQTVMLVAGDTWSSLQSKISTATGGTVSLNLGANSVSLTSAAPVQLGSPSDTSNFLSAARLLGAAQTTSGGVYTTASNQLLGAAVTSNPLSTAGFNVAGGIAASGTFQINGVAIQWANTDSLNGILTRINASAAGVTATYDPKQDKINLTNSNTGAQSISLVDSTGNFLAAAHLTAATQSYGAPAQYTITQNGVTSVTQYSNSNKVLDAVQGVNLTLLSSGTTSVSVTQDTTTASTNIQNFVTQFNSLVDLIDTDTKYDSSTNTASVLTGDSAITGLRAKLRSLVSQAAQVPAGSAYASLGDIGVSTGAYGSIVGSTNHLVLDTTKLTNALQSNPQAVAQVLSGLSGTTSTSGDAAHPWIQTATGTPYGQVYSGSYKVTYDPSGTISSVFTSTGGSARPAVKATIAAGGTNTSLIPGVSISARNPLPSAAGTDTISYTVSSRGVLQSLNDYLNTTAHLGGIFDTEHTDATSSLSNISAQITNQNTLLAQRQTSLQAQFTAMEVALSKLQTQGSSLLSQLGVTSSTSSSSSSA